MQQITCKYDGSTTGTLTPLESYETVP